MFAKQVSDVPHVWLSYRDRHFVNQRFQHITTMDNIPASAAIISELNERGYEARLDGTLVSFEIAPETGRCRTYTVARVGDNWQVNLTEVVFVEDGEDNEEQTFIGGYTSAIAIADAIEQHENEP